MPKVPIRQSRKVYRAIKKGRIGVGTAQYVIRHDVKKNYANPVASKRK